MLVNPVLCDDDHSVMAGTAPIPHEPNETLGQESDRTLVDQTKAEELGRYYFCHGRHATQQF